MNNIFRELRLKQHDEDFEPRNECEPTGARPGSARKVMAMKKILLGCSDCGFHLQHFSRTYYGTCPACKSNALTLADCVPTKEEINKRSALIREKWTVERWSSQHVTIAKPLYFNLTVKQRNSIDDDESVQMVDCPYWMTEFNT
jgi:predicted Zn-ribbon and HTH transcriptional regulator